MTKFAQFTVRENKGCFCPVKNTPQSVTTDRKRIHLVTKIVKEKIHFFINNKVNENVAKLCSNTQILVNMLNETAHIVLFTHG